MYQRPNHRVGGVLIVFVFLLLGPVAAQRRFGIPGPRGKRGLQGETGSQGATGVQGLAGLNGATGSQGQQGATGATGSSSLVQTTSFATGASVTVVTINAFPASRVFDIGSCRTSTVVDSATLNNDPVTESQFSSTCSQNHTLLNSLYATVYVNVGVASSNPSAVLQVTTLVRLAAAGSGSSAVLLQPFVDTGLSASANFTQQTSVQQAKLISNLLDTVTCQAGDRFVVQTRVTLLNDPLALGASASVTVAGGVSTS